jgi:hypothetical protein
MDKGTESGGERADLTLRRGRKVEGTRGGKEILRKKRSAYPPADLMVHASKHHGEQNSF